jgi:hypothetical protein
MKATRNELLKENDDVNLIYNCNVMQRTKTYYFRWNTQNKIKACQIFMCSLCV